jgi:dienelactone hydrolase
MRSRTRPPALPALLILLACRAAITDDRVAVAAAAAAPTTRATFLKLIDRPRVDPAVREDATSDDGLTLIRFYFSSDAADRVPGLLLKWPDSGRVARRPAVIAAHGTGGKKEDELPLLRALARKGFVAVAIDARYHGERGSPADYNAAIARAFERGDGSEHPLYWDTVWDLMRLVDVLQARRDVDGERIGLVGFSKGGIETYFTAAADVRIACAVPCIGVQSFKWAVEHEQWQGRVGTVRKSFDAAARFDGVDHPDAAFVRRFYQRVVPGIDGEFDGPKILPLIAPRPLLIINGDRDDKTPLDGVALAAGAARSAYLAAGAEDRFKRIVESNTGHAVTKEAREEAVAWLAKWLRPEGGRTGRDGN